MYRIGSIEIHPVVDAQVWVDSGGEFGVVPRALWEKVITPDALSRIPMDLISLLVRADGKTILVDAGLGDKMSPKQLGYWGLDRPGTLLEKLAGLDVAPADVDIVVLTHLHADHCGWSTLVRGGEIAPTFPNAAYLVQRLEYADACFPNERTRATYLPENFKPLEAAGQLRLLMGDAPVVEGVRCAVTRGHTRSHQSVVFESAGEYGLFTGDMASFMVNFERLAWVTAYDIEPLETIETKRAWQQWALARNALIFSCHDAARPVGRLREVGGRLEVEAVAAQ
ncbi:MAG: MBL fold metallo-hydrolase [Anaerolineae bacterium]|nr:MBL fold metallo-hydrolase [Anaerolineae bacterium]